VFAEIPACGIKYEVNLVADLVSAPFRQNMDADRVSQQFLVVSISWFTYKTSLMIFRPVLL
jgi:hypothetical protein